MSDDACRKPVIGIPSSRMLNPNARMHSHSTAERNIHSLLEYMDCLPIQLPALGDKCDIRQIVGMIDGLLLPGGRANVEPHHYGGPAFPEDEIIDPARDGLVLKLIPACLEAGIPVFGICRGIQEINVALGGSLHYRVHLLAGKLDHRRPQIENLPIEEVFKPRHMVSLDFGGLFSKLTGAAEVRVNSLHGQGIDRLASELTAEAICEDGLIEGVRLKNGGPFCVGVQWHAEYDPQNNILSDAIYKEFTRACAAHAEKRAG